MPVPEIDVDQLAKLHAEGVPIIDVRQPDEYVSGHVPGAVLIPLADVPERVEDIPGDQPVYVICRSGARSARAVEFLLGQGLDATNIAGGTLAWVAIGGEVSLGLEP